MKKSLIILLLTVCIAATSCKKVLDSITEPPPTQIEAKPTAVGVPIGDGVTKEIDGAGGSISSADGKIEVVVPAGSVTGNTSFSIQPISNFCPGGVEAFRLLPEGLVFTKPVTIKFNYTDDELDGSLAAFFGIAFQDKDNIWYKLPSAEIDSVNKNISVKVSHFTDWSKVQGLKINSGGIRSLKVKEAATLKLEGIPQEDDDLPDLLTGLPLRENLPFNAKWYVNGIREGSETVGEIIISPGSDGKIVRYKAPARVPSPSTVVITAELTDYNGIWYSFFNGRRYTFNKVILYKRIKILPDEHNFTVRYEITANNACAYPGQKESDAADFDVNVKGNIVTITNIVNQRPAAITPLTISVGNCTMTATAGTTGYINFVKGGGEVEEDPFGGEVRLALNLTNSGATTNTCVLACPGVTSPATSHTIEDGMANVSFLLKDSIQEEGQKNVGIYWKLTPKPQ